jgi:hypothetical protein
LAGRKPTSSPFYTLYDIGPYTFAPWKVLWLRPAKRLEAAVVGQIKGKPIIPQETITLVALDSESEAHYLCALINNSIANLTAVRSGHAGTKSFGSPEVLARLSIPRFNPRNPLHLRLAKLSQRCHLLALGGDKQTLKERECIIDESAAQVWGISKEELKAIQAELKGKL